MAIKWIKAEQKGLRYYEHPSRKISKTGRLGRDASFLDRYYAIRFKANGVDHSYGIGWMSDGVPDSFLEQEPGLEFVDYCLKLLRHYKNNVKTGAGPESPKEKKKLINEERARDTAEKKRAEAEQITLDKFFTDTYLPQAQADKKPRSVEREQGLYNVWIEPALGSKPMKDIIPLHLEKLKRDMAGKGQSPRSIEYALSTIRHIFNVAIRSGAFKGSSPMATIKIKKPDNARMRFLTREEADRLLAALKEKAPDVHDVTLLSLHAGLRFGEIASLTWQDVNLEKGTLTIRDAKAGSRFAFLTDQATAMLKARTPGKPSDFVFPSRKSDIKGEKVPIEAENLAKKKMIQVSATFSRTVKELGLNKGIDDPRLQICFHSCRHSYASWLIEEGADLYTVQRLLGHKTNIMTQRYSHLSEGRLRDAAKALSMALRPQEKAEESAGQVVNFTK